MKKNLKIKFWKAEKALAMQILEQEGLPRRKEEGTVHIINCPALKRYTISLRGNQHLDDFNLNHWYFENNSERDEYLDKITQAIVDELFTSADELKVGETCEVSDCGEYWGRSKLLAILPEGYDQRYIVKFNDFDKGWCSFAEARPLTKRIEPKVETNGEIVTYTWEEE